jgi:hypothetical protein
MGDVELDLGNMDVKRERTRALDRTKWHLCEQSQGQT